MKREEIDNLLEQIKDMRDQISNLYYDALSTKNEFDTDSEEWDKIDRAMDGIKGASDNLESAIYELSLRRPEMIKTYFTFGSDPLFPFGRDEYVVVYGGSIADCVHKFMKKYPNPRLDRSHIVNCAFFYKEEEWREKCAYFYGPEPAEVIE